MKKTLCLLLALLLTLSACALTGASAEADLTPAEVNFWVTGTGEQADTDKVDEQLRKMIEEALPNTTLKMTYIGDGYKDKLEKALAAGERIDLAWAGWMFDKSKMVREGTILPMGELMQQYGQDIIAALGEDCINLHREKDGELYYAVSWQGLVGNRGGLYLPTELVNEMPEGWKEDLQNAFYAFDDGEYTDENWQKVYDGLDTYAGTLKEKGKLHNGFYVDSLTMLLKGHEKPGLGGDFWSSYGYVAFGDDTFTVKPFVTEENGWLRYARAVSDFYKKGYIQSDIASASQSIQWNGELTDTDYINNSHAALDDGIEARLSAQYNLPITVLFTSRACTWTKGDATCVVLPYTCKEPERAMMVLNQFYGNPELYQTFVYGLKDVHWTDNGDGTVTTLGGAGQATSDWPYGQWKWVIGTCMNAFVTQADTAGYYEGLKAQEATAYASPFLNFSFDKTNVETELSNLNAVMNEYRPMFYLGYLGDELDAKWEEMLAKLDAAGLQTYLAEYQRQVTEYVTANNSHW